MQMRFNASQLSHLSHLSQLTTALNVHDLERM